MSTKHWPAPRQSNLAYWLWSSHITSTMSIACSWPDTFIQICDWQRVSLVIDGSMVARNIFRRHSAALNWPGVMGLILTLGGASCSSLVVIGWASGRMYLWVQYSAPTPG